jgi:hypothetical protein
MYPEQSNALVGGYGHKQAEFARIESARMASVGGGATSAPQKPPSEISVQLAQQEKGLDYLHQQLSTLQDRLSSVLIPEGPMASGASDRESLGSGLAAHLRNHNDQLALAVSRVDDLIRRVAL